MRTKDQRSTQALSYRKLYNTARWLRTREQVLDRAGRLCQRCLRKGHVSRATVCHHLLPELKKDPNTFFVGPFEALCTQCHDGPTQQQERIGFTTEVGADGWPTDPRHPANATSRPMARSTGAKR